MSAKEDEDSSGDEEGESDPMSDCNELEHIAGPHCVHEGGYSGHEITAEEMSGCTTHQCLIRKGEKWQPEADDQEFELNGKYFLSGLSGHMPSTDDGGHGPDYLPARHGVWYEWPICDVPYNVRYNSCSHRHAENYH